MEQKEKTETKKKVEATDKKVRLTPKNSALQLLPLYLLTIIGCAIAISSLFFSYDGYKQSSRLQMQQMTTLTHTHQQASNLETTKQQLADLSNALAAVNQKQALQDTSVKTLEENLAHLASKTNQDSEDWTLLEVQHLLYLANYQIQYLQQITPAKVLLNLANKRLKRLSKTDVGHVRYAITQDLVKLHAVPHVDVIKLFAQLTALNMRLEQLTLLIPQTPEIKPEKKESSLSLDSWRNALNNSWEQIRSLVVIRHNEEPIKPLLAPGQQIFLQQNLRLLLQQAKWAILQRKDQLYQSTLQQIKQLVLENYDSESPQGEHFIKTLTALQETNVAPKLPKITLSLDAINSLIQQRQLSAIKEDKRQ